MSRSCGGGVAAGTLAGVNDCEIETAGNTGMSGHSKWSTIKHKKGKTDALRSKVFSKLSKEITVAAKMGMPDVDMNPRLRLAVKAAKAQSMPKDVIDRAIKKSQMGDGADYTEIRYEGYGANGIAIIVEAMTDNLNRTASNVRSYFTKNGGNLGETGSVGFMFDRVGEVTYPAEIGDADTVMMAAIEAGNRLSEYMPGDALQLLSGMFQGRMATFRRLIEGKVPMIEAEVTGLALMGKPVRITVDPVMARRAAE